jgi:hypothetical protein
VCLAGWLLFAFIAATSAVALPWVTKRFFAFFYRCHLAFALLIGVAALCHGFGSAVFNGYLPMSIPGATFWFIDLLIRFFSINCMALPSDVSATAVYIRHSLTLNFLVPVASLLV